MIAELPSEGGSAFIFRSTASHGMFSIEGVLYVTGKSGRLQKENLF